MVSPIAEFVVDIGSDGRILSQGTLENALAHDSKLLKDVEHEAEELQKADQEIDGEKAEEVDGPSSAGKLVVAEEMELGHVGWRASEQATESFVSHPNDGVPSVAVTRQRVDKSSSVLVHLHQRLYLAPHHHEPSGKFVNADDVTLITRVARSVLVARRLGSAVRNYSSRRGACHVVSGHWYAVGSMV